MQATVTKSVLEKLAQFDTPTISNTIELFQVMPRTEGFMDERIRAAFPEMPPMVGFAATATCQSSSPNKGVDVYANVENQLAQFQELPGPVVAVYEDLDVPSVGVTCGDIICSCFKAFGSVGLITSGYVRDLDQIRALSYPLFSSGVVCSHSYLHTIELDVPVNVGGLEVHTGDLLHGDLNGVTKIPLEIAAEVADVASEFAALEAPVLDYAQSPGEKSITKLVELRKAMSQAIADLSQRVRG